MNNTISNAVPVIFDTDMDGDCDDTGALAILHALMDYERANILGVICDVPLKATADCAMAINRYYKRGDIPIGLLSENNEAGEEYCSRREASIDLTEMERELYTEKISSEFNIDSISALDIGSQSSFEFQWSGNDYYKKYDLLMDGSLVLGELIFVVNGKIRDLSIGSFTGTNVHVTIKSDSIGGHIDISGSGEITGIDYDGPYLTLDWGTLSASGDIQTDWIDHDTLGSGTIYWVSSNGFSGYFNFQTTLFKS